MPVDHDRYRRPAFGDPDVEDVLAQLGLRGDDLDDLGGTMSLNVRCGDVVVRFHPPFASRNRIARLRDLRRELGDAGLVVGEPLPLLGRELVRSGRLVVEAERHVPHTKPPFEWDSWRWLFEAIGHLHRATGSLRTPVPRPDVATYGTPSSMRRWLARIPPSIDTTHLADLVRRLERRWVPTTGLPALVVHGDVRLGNAVRRDVDGATTYLDFGFAATRPAIHDLAYSLSWLVLRPDARGTGDDFPWHRLPELFAAYEDAARRRLTADEHAAFAPRLAAVPLDLASVAGYTPDPAANLLEDAPFLAIADWVLEHLQS